MLLMTKYNLVFNSVMTPQMSVKVFFEVGITVNTTKTQKSVHAKALPSLLPQARYSDNPPPENPGQEISRPSIYHNQQFVHLFTSRKKIPAFASNAKQVGIFKWYDKLSYTIVDLGLS